MSWGCLPGKTVCFLSQSELADQIYSVGFKAENAFKRDEMRTVATFTCCLIVRSSALPAFPLPLFLLKKLLPRT